MVANGTSARACVVFMGTPEFAVPTLEGPPRVTPSVVGVVTQPDRPRGRGQKTSDAPVKAHAIAAGVPIFNPRPQRSRFQARSRPPRRHRRRRRMRQILPDAVIARRASA